MRKVMKRLLVEDRDESIFSFIFFIVINTLCRVYCYLSLNKYVNVHVLTIYNIFAIIFWRSCD
ncbi:hypothetical protein HanRHA438_Chr04g0172611 [Helianthus annuus]|uniref:Uncharacterized protein n=1 Tax=Helianthus annuus TaxID=4232 RepID=A0A9K3J7I6_HELAN|nr:hypothetical protein HanXRQr2_Chr04g0162481 [Helianthus annuus]KAJ0580819.1 hypothetical protein HanHA300_Chr04g0133761 [Helianthus annuus]KAJ0588524.1 hypothetical protein HanIR_Chr04g0175661 [Helianthus annuus]KAJ0596759.1 hypothetical protein HanHA89_Chr04g0146631 [Helianthus annuus]KAJ0757439.1 hypothetical protein HanLR1_Chr04g0138761 [Helianthus annuus]